ncbi:capsid staple protein [Bradyrhizobium sp. PMVTL-01]|uniref:capsid staple protein n=1 Tax=Bradyrhizobium sp. PMVTL-01 TaxID=3434999 RepID=UPI003F7062FB
MFAKMVSMANTPEEVKESMADAPSVAPAKFTGPKYPWGLSISLEDQSLKKLGLDGDLPVIGDVIQFIAEAKVTNASLNERETTDGKTEQCCRIELQITDMGIAPGDSAEEQVERSKARRKRFYPGMDADTDNDGE